VLNPSSEPSQFFSFVTPVVRRQALHTGGVWLATAPPERRMEVVYLASLSVGICVDIAVAGLRRVLFIAESAVFRRGMPC